MKEIFLTEDQRSQIEVLIRELLDKQKAAYKDENAAADVTISGIIHERFITAKQIKQIREEMLGIAEKPQDELKETAMRMTPEERSSVEDFITKNKDLKTKDLHAALLKSVKLSRPIAAFTVGQIRRDLGIKCSKGPKPGFKTDRLSIAQVKSDSLGQSGYSISGLIERIKEVSDYAEQVKRSFQEISQ